MAKNQNTQVKQLKKSDFLAAITEEPMTRGELVDSLTDYEFVSSYIDYLAEHFQAQNKVVLEGDFVDGGTIQRRGRKVSAPRGIFYVVEDENGEYSMEKDDTLSVVTDGRKEEGWRTTPGAAVKAKTSAIFAKYKADTARVRELLEAEEGSAEAEAEEPAPKKRRSRKK